MSNNNRETWDAIAIKGYGIGNNFDGPSRTTTIGTDTHKWLNFLGKIAHPI